MAFTFSALLPVDELPNIQGSFYIADNAARNGNEYGVIAGAEGVLSASSFSHNTVAVNATTVTVKTVKDMVSLNFGGNAAHNNVAPVKAVYAWLRTA